MNLPRSHVRADKRRHRRIAWRSGVMCLGLALGAGMHAAVSAADAKTTPILASTKRPAQPETALVKVDDAWVRATVKGQTASGGFMSLTASRDLTLVGFSTPAAGETELHEMVMDNGIMRMRALDVLPLPAGRVVTLKPGAGGQHLMLMDLRKQLVEGQEIVLSLRLRTAAGKLLKQDVKVQVKAGLKAPPPQGAGATPAGMQGDDQGGHAHHPAQ